ncbi:hypothetical protein [Pseudoalteromonas sp. G4]|uniref:hypothetical protein n=1 Tax=Pseudoalteromonas sp. G4 TaxID=2992761 RepID=UPI00237D65F8|nr:hypothetical protein [Pseudoalteromonas sp. G4]MDE3272742.1 hypothetical protein [Pseudoalteromonas sp. G4]
MISKKHFIYCLSITALYALPATANKEILKNSKNAFDSLISSCSSDTFYKNEVKFEKLLELELASLDKGVQKKLLYKQSDDGILVSFFGTPFLHKKIKANHLDICWSFKYEISLTDSNQEKKQSLKNWYSCASDIFREEIPMIKNYYICQLEAIEDSFR